MNYLFPDDKILRKNKIRLLFFGKKGKSPNFVPQRGNSSAGRARPCQGRGRGFESRFPLQVRCTYIGLFLFSTIPFPTFHTLLPHGNVDHFAFNPFGHLGMGP